MSTDRDGGCSTGQSVDWNRFLDNDLSPRRRRQLEAHLQQCPGCRQRLEEMRATRECLRLAPKVSLPRSFTLSPDQVPRQRQLLWYPALRALTTAVAALLLLFFLADWLQQPSPPTPAAAPSLVAIRPTPPVTVPRPSAAVAPAITGRPAATPLSSPEIAARTSPSAAGMSISSCETAYPSPEASPPAAIQGTVARSRTSPARPTTFPLAQPQEAPIGEPLPWTAKVGGLSLLGLLAALTWLAYRRERFLLP